MSCNEHIGIELYHELANWCCIIGYICQGCFHDRVFRFLALHSVRTSNGKYFIGTVK